MRWEADFMENGQISDNPVIEPEKKEEIPPVRKSWFRRLISKFSWIVPPFKRAWRESALFSHLAWPGAAIGSFVVVVVFMTYMGYALRTGLGTALDMILSAVVTALALALLGLVVMLIATIFRAWPRLFTGAFLGALLFLPGIMGALGGPGGFALRVSAVLVLLLALLGGCISVLLRKGENKAKTSHRIAASILMVAGLSLVVILAIWLIGPGKDPYLTNQEPVSGMQVPSLSAPNPADSGSYKVKTLIYGSGADKRRPEFGPPVTLKTSTIDARPLVKKNLEGFRAKVRKWYWGFGTDQFPLNGRVWYPDGPGPFPLVLIVHGNHSMDEYSDPGYAYLGELLASRGFILVSVDENFMNGSWIGGINKENGVRGWILLKHLELWRGWNETAGNPFHRKVDFSNIALIGHSRGGEAIAHAAAFNRLSNFPDDANVRFNFNFPIKTLIAIAPIDGQYEPANQPVPVENLNYLVLQGSHDSDVSIFAGFRPYRRVKFTDGQYWMKAAIYTYRANHGQFNTVWGSYDGGPPFDRFINTQPLLKGAEQRQIARVYISGFLEATLHGRAEYIPMFRDYRAISGWLPGTIYLSQFEDSRFKLVSNFDNTIDVTRTAVPGGVQSGDNLNLWRAQELKGRSDYSFKNNAVFLGWDNEEEKSGDKKSLAVYSVTLPDGLAEQWQMSEKAKLVFSAADTDEDPHQSEIKDEKKNAAAGDKEKKKDSDKEKDKKRDPIDLTLELVSGNGAIASLPLSRFLPIQPALKVKFTKWDYIESEFYKKPVEPVFQTFEIPLAEFLKAAAGFDLSMLKTIRFRFDRTKKGVIALDEIGFAF
jgi:drug/metabolite transporter (DMT)-like permease/dienelactone hydrolase